MAGQRIGLDVVSVGRIKRSLTSHGEAFRRRLLTPEESLYCRGPREAERVAGRVAAKEAVMKALGSGWPYLPWNSIEVLPGARGRPEVRLHGKALKMMAELGLGCIEVSITHDGGFAMAVAVAGSCAPPEGLRCIWSQPKR